MKKLFMICGFAMMGFSAVSAQSESFYGLANHVGVGVGIGTTGISIEAATCLTPYVGVRAGVNIVPKFKLSTDLDVEGVDATPLRTIGFTDEIPESVEVEGKLSMTTGHVLFDIHPFKTGFRITAGAYFGGSEIISVYNKEDGSIKSVYNANQTIADAKSRGLITEDVKRIGVALGDYLLTPDEDGNVNATLEVAGFRPYLGLGFGHAVPKKRLSVQFDAGVQFWGSPKVYLDGADGRHRLTEEDTKGEDGGAIKTLSKITVYPCLSLRLVGRIL
ncbi:MAG: hypothetical protein ACI4TW_08630 [Prevotella sp.]